MANIGEFSTKVENDLLMKSYHILNTSFAPDSYPNRFPKFKKINKIKIGGVYVVRLFVKNYSGETYQIDSGMIDIKINTKKSGGFGAEILTLLPSGFPLSKGQIIDVKKEEILYEQI